MDTDATRTDRAQLGTIEVDAETLRLDGELLAELAVRLGFTLDGSPVSPEGGWRVLLQAHGQFVLGAPLDDAQTTWRLGSADDDGGAPVSFHPVPQQLRPGRAERRRGLELRWPATLGALDPAHLAIDVVNVGDEIWRPDGQDSFRVVGIIDTGNSTSSVYFGFAGGGEPAFALGPGEYARVKVHVNPSQWTEIEPGEQCISALLLDLELRSQETRRITVDATELEQLRPQRRADAGGEGEASERRRRLAERLEVLCALHVAGRSIHDVMDTISAADDREDAVARVGELLGCESDAAAAVVAAPLGRFARRDLERIERELTELERSIAVDEVR